MSSGGFLLGRLVIHEGAPGLGVFLTPVGGLFLVARCCSPCTGYPCANRYLRGEVAADSTRGGTHERSRERSGEERRT